MPTRSDPAPNGSPPETNPSNYSATTSTTMVHNTPQTLDERRRDEPILPTRRPPLKRQRRREDKHCRAYQSRPRPRTSKRRCAKTGESLTTTKAKHSATTRRTTCSDRGARATRQHRRRQARFERVPLTPVAALHTATNTVLGRRGRHIDTKNKSRRRFFRPAPRSIHTADRGSLVNASTRLCVEVDLAESRFV